MPQFFSLRLQRVDKARMGMTQRVHSNAGTEIEIFFARLGLQPRAITADEPQIGAPIGGHYMRRVFARTHSNDTNFSKFVVFANFAIYGRAADDARANEKTAPKGGLNKLVISKADMPVNNLFR